MNQRILKLLWLDDGKLKSYSKLFSYLHFILGILLFIVSIIIFYILSGLGKKIFDWSISVSNELKNLNESTLRETNIVNTASELLENGVTLSYELLYAILALILFCGFLLFFQGLLYQRINEIIRKNPNH